MTDGELLQRLAEKLKKDIGPAVDDEYPKTQAFMAAVVTEKLGRQIALSVEHEAADRADIAALLGHLEDKLNPKDDPVALSQAVTTLAENPSAAGLCQFIETLYASRRELGDGRFDSLLGRIRFTLRLQIDRQMVIAA